MKPETGRAVDPSDAPLLCFAGNDWWVHNPYTEKQWMRRLAANGRRVLFVNSIGIGLPSLSSPRVFTRVAMKLKSMARMLRRSEGVWVFTPLVLPFWTVTPIARFNVFLLALQLRTLLRILGMRRPLFWTGIPTAALLLDRIPHRASVYYIQDNVLAYYDRMSFSRVQEHHALLLKHCDAVICASIGMHAERSAERSGVYYVPHGVSKGFFEADGSKQNATPPLMAHIPHPIIGYWGSLEVLQDQDLICRMAEAHPEWSIVFIGRPMYDTSRVRSHANTHFLGYLPIDEIARYGAHFDVAMISWVQSDWVRYSAPVKFREYYALGKPVVSADIIEVAESLPGARTAKSIDEFVRCLEEELASDTPEKQLWRRSLVEGQTWEWSAKKVEEVLRGL